MQDEPCELVHNPLAKSTGQVQYFNRWPATSADQQRDSAGWPANLHKEKKNGCFILIKLLMFGYVWNERLLMFDILYQ